MTKNQLIHKLLGKSAAAPELTATEKTLFNLYYKLLNNIRGELKEIYLKYGAEDAYKEMSRYKRFKSLEASVTADVGAALGASREKINSLLRETFKIEYVHLGSSLEKALDINLNFSSIDQKVITKAIENPLEFVSWKGSLKANHQKAVKQITTEIASGLRQGQPYRKVAKAIKEKVEGLTNNTYRIVRTESHRVANEARLEGIENAEKSFERLKIKSYRVWVASPAPKVDRHYPVMNGQKADKDGYFHFTDGVKTKAPGQSGVAHHDINCRCFLITEVDDGGEVVSQNVEKEIAKTKKETVPTKKEINKWMESNYQGKVNYPKTKPRFRGRTTEQYGKFNIRTLDEKQAALLQSLLNEANVLSDKIGIPRVRGIVAGGGGAANMGDGVMSFSKRSFNQIGNSPKNPRYKQWLNDIIAENKKLIEKGFAPKTTTGYFIESSEQCAKVRFWHEYGHQIHQQKGVIDEASYKHPPLENKIRSFNHRMSLKAREAYNSGDKSYFGKVYPSEYCYTSPMEWFAENYSLYRMGQADLISKDFINFLIEEGIE